MEKGEDIEPEVETNTVFQAKSSVKEEED